MPERGPMIRVLTGLAAAAVAVGCLLAGRLPFSILVAALAVAAYAELRPLLAPASGRVSFVAGAAAVLGFMWVGYDGDLSNLGWVAGSLLLFLLVLRIIAHERGSPAGGVTADVAATFAAAGTIGVFAAHVLLIRAVPQVGFKAVTAFGLFVLLNDAVAFGIGHTFGRRRLSTISPHKTWEGAVAGFGASVVVGLAVGVAMDPPFAFRSGLAFGVGMGVLAPLGDLVFSSVKRSAGVKESGRLLGSLGGVLDTVDAVLFTAPAFYWALRTIAL